MKIIPQRKAAQVAAKIAQVAAIHAALEPVARGLGGRFWLYGSAARNALRYDSDIDLLLDFPDDATTRIAWTEAERVCAEQGMPYDIRPVEWCDQRFLDHVLPGAQPWPPLSPDTPPDAV